MDDNKRDASSQAQQGKLRERIVVVGGGFAGLSFVKHIDKTRYDVVVVDRNNFHSFPPLFYQVAAGQLDPASISFPFRRELSKRRAKGASFHMGKVMAVDFEARTVVTDHETLAWDKLVIAAGTTNNFFGNPDLHRRVYTLKSTGEALRLRNEVLDRLERAAICSDPEARRRMLTFVVVGGGPTGVEIAGALGEMKRWILSREYPSIEPSEVRIVLLEGSDRLLGAMSPQASRDALRYLGELMVEVRLNTLMQSYADMKVLLPDGQTIDTETVVWTAGITGEKFNLMGLPDGSQPTGPGGRFLTDCQCRVKGLQDVWALGDIGLCLDDPAWPRGLPQLAQPAIQQARYVARQLNGKEPADKPFAYRDKGTMATVGRNRAVADLARVHLSGLVAWLAWMLIHLLTLMGMRNRVVVLINWIWAYCSLSTSLRLIIRPTRWPERRGW